MSAPEPTPGFEAESLAMARAIFEGTGEIGVRRAHVDGEAGRILASIPCIPGARDALRALLVRERARGVAVMGEVWYASQEAGATRSALPADLSTYEGRRERVVVMVEHRAIADSVARMWRAEITRDGSGAPTLGPWALGEGETYSGRMVGLLPPLAEGARA